MELNLAPAFVSGTQMHYTIATGGGDNGGMRTLEDICIVPEYLETYPENVHGYKRMTLKYSRTLARTNTVSALFTVTSTYYK